jgi:hypothetical protein
MKRSLSSNTGTPAKLMWSSGQAQVLTPGTAASLNDAELLQHPDFWLAPPNNPPALDFDVTLGMPEVEPVDDDGDAVEAGQWRTSTPNELGCMPLCITLEKVSVLKWGLQLKNCISPCKVIASKFNFNVFRSHTRFNY